MYVARVDFPQPMGPHMNIRGLMGSDFIIDCTLSLRVGVGRGWVIKE
jgi:hypothetical protein